MKAAETKPATAAASSIQKKSEKPFFQKNGEGGFFSKESSPRVGGGWAGGEGPFFIPSTTGTRPAIQAKLTIGSPDDPLEREADRMADHVVQRMSAAGAGAGTAEERMREDKLVQEKPLVQRKCAACQEEEIQPKRIDRKPMFDPEKPVQRKCTACESEQIQPKSDGSATASAGVESAISSSKGGGSPLPENTRSHMESSLGHDFSGVRVHTGSEAAGLSQQLGAQAFTHGSDVYFNEGKYSPGSTEGVRLLGHELGHVVQQNPDGSIHRRVNPTDVSGEMIGREFTATEARTIGTITVNVGDTLIINSWINTSLIVNVHKLRQTQNFDFPKELIIPKANSVAGVSQYSSGIDSVIGDIATGETRIRTENARRGGPNPGEIARLQGLQAIRHTLLNKRLIQQTMFNRFDVSIKTWVDFYNIQYRFTGSRALNPNLVKSMIFQESQMGTSGQHLEIPPSHPVKSRFNVGQVIDSSAAALIIMIREMEPSLILSFHLSTIDQDRVQAELDLRTLRAKTNRTPTEDTRLTNLNHIDSQPGMFSEGFMWQYRAPGQPTGFQEAVTDFFQTSTINRANDYDFWIRTMVKWLFEKRQSRSVASWAEAIRAYNGSGASARAYRDSVTARSQSATQSTAAHPFTPTGI